MTYIHSKYSPTHKKSYRGYIIKTT